MHAPLVAKAKSTGPQGARAIDPARTAQRSLGTRAAGQGIAPSALSKIPVHPPSGAGRPTPLFPTARFPIQAKLKVGAVDDPLEHEADRVADQVMRVPAPVRGLSSAPPQVSRKCAECEEEDRKLQKKEAGSAAPTLAEATASVHEVLRSPGQPLDAATRAYFEPRFGRDFSEVRVHSGSAAAQSARDINANAYTVRENIVFGAGQFAPNQSFGRTLLAHELAHVVQQGRPEYPAASQGNCERDAEDAAGSVGSGNAPMVRTGAVFGAVQRQAATEPIARQAAQKKSRLVRIERYWRSPSARAFFEDGSNEEVTFIEARSLDPATQPEGVYEKVVDLTIDRSSPIRPHVEFASYSSGSKVKVVTRLSPADRISKLPAKVRAEVSEAFLGDTENESDPETMEFAADMGERLKETSGTTKIEMEGRDPATVATMKAVDQWVSKQRSSLDKLGTIHRAKFTHLLNDIRQVGVTGPVKAEDLNAEDIELVLAGAAGGQSEFQTFDEFKRGMTFKLRSGRISLPEENAHNPDFAIRNEYRKAWKAEAAGLRKMSRIAAAAQAAPFLALGASAAAGTLLFGGEAFVAGLVAKGVPPALIGKWVGTSLLASGAVSHFVAARDEAKAAGMDPDSALGIANTASVAFLGASGIGEVSQSITDTSILTRKPLNRSTFERITGGIAGTASALGTFGTFVPEAPNVPAAAAPHPIGTPLPGVALAMRLQLAEVMQGAENARVNLGLNAPASSMVETLGADTAPGPVVASTPAPPVETAAVAPGPPTTAPDVQTPAPAGSQTTATRIEPFPRVDVRRGRAFPASTETPTAARSMVSTSRGADETAAAAAASGEVTLRPHEARAQFLKQERDLVKQRKQAIEQEKAFGTQAGEYEAELENVTNDARRKHLEGALIETEKKEQAAGARIGEIDRDLAELNRKLRELAQRGVDPSAGYVSRAIGSADFVSLEQLDHPPAGILESAGAEKVPGQRIEGQRVLAAVESEAAMRTHIEASAAEDFVYKDALSRGEVGLQRYGRVNVSGPDTVTARRNAAGQMEIVFHDATIDPKKEIDEPPATWFAEAKDAIVINPDSSTRLQLHNDTLEKDIRDAFEQGRFVLEATLVKIGPDGVRFTLLSSKRVSAPPKTVP